MPAIRSILAIEDDPIIRALLQAFFQIPGYRIVCAADGTEALGHLSTDTFDVVLTDLMMPGHNGWEMIALIHERHPTLAIILVSGSLFCSSAEEMAKARALGAADVLPKPFSRAQLFAAIDRALDQVAPASAGG